MVVDGRVEERADLENDLAVHGQSRSARHVCAARQEGHATFLLNERNDPRREICAAPHVSDLEEIDASNPRRRLLLGLRREHLGIGRSRCIGWSGLALPSPDRRDEIRRVQLQPPRCLDAEAVRIRPLTPRVFCSENERRREVEMGSNEVPKRALLAAHRSRECTNEVGVFSRQRPASRQASDKAQFVDKYGEIELCPRHFGEQIPKRREPRRKAELPLSTARAVEDVEQALCRPGSARTRSNDARQARRGRRVGACCVVAH